MERKQGQEAFREVRVVHPWTFSYYGVFLDLMKETYGVDVDNRWLTDDSMFKDGSDYLQVIYNESLKERVHALVPFWIAPLPTDRSLAKPFFAAHQLGNALSYKGDKGARLADRLIGIAPYLEVRQDRVNKPGEAVTANMLAQILKAAGYTDLVTLDIHSAEAARFIRKTEIEHVNMTAIPLFVDLVQERGWVTKNTRIGALDIGALQRCWHAAKLMGLTAKDVVVFKKRRGDHNIVRSSSLLYVYGDLRGKDMILIDDLLDTGSSITESVLALREAGVKSVIVMLSHGVLSRPARKNIADLLQQGIITSLTLTNSLPRGAFLLEGIKGVEVVNVAPLMMGAARLLSLLGKEAMRQLSGIESFILQPRNKIRVWKEFAGEVGVNWKIIND